MAPSLGQDSGEDILDDVAVDIGQAEVTSGVAIRQLRVVEAQEVQNGRVQVVDMYHLLDGTITKPVGGAVDVAALHPTGGQPGREAPVIEIAAHRRLAPT